MSQQKYRPDHVTLDRESRQLRVDWSDQHVSAYPLDGLREACPCAECRGGHEFMGPQYDPDLIQLKPARSYEVRDLQIVGNYALQFQWSDGHQAGIYTWDYLRRICPCPECRAAKQHSTPPAASP